MYQSAETIVSAELDSGERLLWSGQPRGGIRFCGQDLFLIPFSLVWGGFAIFWEVMVLTAMSKTHSPLGIIFPLFGLPFVVIGIYLIFGRFFVDARMRDCTFYGVTSERIIIISGLFSRQLKSLPVRSLADFSLSERSDGSGSITFGSPVFMGNMFAGGSWPGAGRYAPPAFDQISGAREVYDIIRNVQRTAGARA